MLFVWATLKKRELQQGAGGWSIVFCENLPSLIFLRLGSSFIGLPSHLSTHSAVLIGKKGGRNQFEGRISCVHLIKCCLASEEKGPQPLWCKPRSHSSSPDKLLPLPSHPLTDLFHPLSSLCAALASPAHLWAPFWLWREEVNSVWLVPVKRMKDEHSLPKKRWRLKWMSADRTSAPPRFPRVSLQREASRQPQPEVKAPISCS